MFHEEDIVEHDLLVHDDQEDEAECEQHVDLEQQGGGLQVQYHARNETFIWNIETKFSSRTDTLMIFRISTFLVNQCPVQKETCDALVAKVHWKLQHVGL